MSTVRCEYCGSSFKYDGQAVCPFCGGSLSGNREVQRIIDEERDREAAARHTANAAREMFDRNMREQQRMGGFVKAFIIIVAAIIFISVIAQFIGMAGLFRGVRGLFI